MSEVNEPAAARDATNWAKKVSTLNVSEVPEGAVAINVEGKRLAGTIQGFLVQRGRSTARRIGSARGL